MIYDMSMIEGKASNSDKFDKSESFKREGGIKLERMKMPNFNGTIREYPRFKSDFLKQVMPEIGSKDKAAYALKSCLSAQPYTKVQNVSMTT